ncbi:unnamed protein product [Chrysoparadoxa australica]
MHAPMAWQSNDRQHRSMAAAAQQQATQASQQQQQQRQVPQPGAAGAGQARLGAGAGAAGGSGGVNSQAPGPSGAPVSGKGQRVPAAGPGPAHQQSSAATIAAAQRSPIHSHSAVSSGPGRVGGVPGRALGGAGPTGLQHSPSQGPMRVPGQGQPQQMALNQMMGGAQGNPQLQQMQLQQLQQLQMQQQYQQQMRMQQQGMGGYPPGYMPQMAGGHMQGMMYGPQGAMQVPGGYGTGMHHSSYPIQQQHAMQGGAARHTQQQPQRVVGAGQQGMGGMPIQATPSDQRQPQQQPLSSQIVRPPAQSRRLPIIDPTTGKQIEVGKKAKAGAAPATDKPAAPSAGASASTASVQGSSAAKKKANPKKEASPLAKPAAAAAAAANGGAGGSHSPHRSPQPVPAEAEEKVIGRVMLAKEVPAGAGVSFGTFDGGADTEAKGVSSASDRAAEAADASAKAAAKAKADEIAAAEAAASKKQAEADEAKRVAAAAQATAQAEAKAREEQARKEEEAKALAAAAAAKQEAEEAAKAAAAAAAAKAEEMKKAAAAAAAVASSKPDETPAGSSSDTATATPRSKSPSPTPANSSQQQAAKEAGKTSDEPAKPAAPSVPVTEEAEVQDSWESHEGTDVRGPPLRPGGSLRPGGMSSGGLRPGGGAMGAGSGGTSFRPGGMTGAGLKGAPPSGQSTSLPAPPPPPPSDLRIGKKDESGLQVYTREELRMFAGLTERPEGLPVFDIQGKAPRGGGGGYRGGGDGYGARGGGGGPGEYRGGGGGDRVDFTRRGKQPARDPRQQQQQQGGNQWQRGQRMPAMERNDGGGRGGGGRGGRGGRGGYQDIYDGPVEPLAMSDNRWKPTRDVGPMQLLGKQVKGILNKMTREKFEKLSQQLLDLPIESMGALDILVDQVFVKAIEEHHFSDMYADLCCRLHNQSSHWNFVKPIYNEDANQWMWTPDQVVDTQVVGPFSTKEECIAVAIKEGSSEEQEPKDRPYDMELVQMIIKEKMMIKIMQGKEPDQVGQFYLVFMSEEAGREHYSVSENAFSSEGDAMKEAAKKTQLRTALLCRCQNEFFKEDIYEDIEKEEEAFQKTDTEALPPVEKREKLAYFAEQRIKMKRRMLGNIQFIGELYKKEMLKESIIHACILKLLNAEEVEEGCMTFCDNTIDEEALEALGKLLATVAKKLDTHKNAEKFKDYFRLLERLSKDSKRVSARIRFMIRDIFDMRKKHWEPRIKQAKAKTLDETRKDFEAEQMRKGGSRGPPMRQQPTSGRDRDRDRDRMGGGQDARGARMGGGGQRGQDARGQGFSGGRDNRDNRPQDFRAGQGGAGGQARDDRDRRRGAPQGSQQAHLRVAGGFNDGRRFDDRARGMQQQPPQGHSRSPQVHQQVPRQQQPQQQLPPEQPEFSEPPEELENKMTGLINEYLHIRDEKEAHACVLELLKGFGVGTGAFFMEHTILKALNGKRVDFEPTVELLAHIVKSGALPAEECQAGVTRVLAVIDDYLCDLPRGKEDLGTILGYLVAAKVVQFPPMIANFMTYCDHIMLEVLGPCLLTLTSLLGAARAQPLLDAQAFCLPQVCPTKADGEKFLEKYGLWSIFPGMLASVHIAAHPNIPELVAWLKDDKSIDRNILCASDYMERLTVHFLGHYKGVTDELLKCLGDVIAMGDQSTPAGCIRGVMAFTTPSADNQHEMQKQLDKRDEILTHLMDAKVLTKENLIDTVEQTKSMRPAARSEIKGLEAVMERLRIKI